MQFDDIDQPLFIFAEDDEDTEAFVNVEEPWRILLVDDDDAVLKVSQLVFKGLVVDGVPIDLIMATSAEMAREQLREHPDVAVALIDVVMEDEAAGLRLIHWIREQSNLQKLRLVLRTGQPGDSPAADVLKDYDINDYWPKTEISAARAQTLLTGLVRSYRDLQKMEIQRRQLGAALETLSSMMFSARNTQSIIASLAEGLCALHETTTPPEMSLYSIAIDDDAFGALTPLISSSQAPQWHVDLLTESWENHQMVCLPECFALYHQSTAGRGLGLIVEVPAPDDSALLNTLTLFIISALSFLQVRLVLEEERELLRSVDRFVPHGLIRAIGHDSVQTVRAGDYTLSTKWVLFADIEGFTSLSESMSLVEVRDMLMSVLQTIIPHITAADGIIEKFMGDGFLALFPSDAPPPIESCLDALEALRQKNIAWRAQGFPELSVSLTLAGGPVLLCTLGDGIRLDITAASDVVNTCARLQSHARLYNARFLATKDIYDATSASLRGRMRSLGDVELRGRQASVPIYEISPRSSGVMLSDERLRSLRQKIVTEEHTLTSLERADLIAQFPDDRVLHAALRIWQKSTGQ